MILPYNDPEYPYYNPSLAYDSDGRLMISVRSCNYSRKGLLHGTHSRTFVYIGEIDPRTLKITNLEKYDYSPDTPSDIKDISGLEDVRLFLRPDGMHAIGVQVFTPDKRRRMAKLAEFIVDEKSNSLHYIRTLAVPNPNVPEKNWSPTNLKSGTFDFQYSPTQVWKDGKVSGDKYTGLYHNGTQLLWQPQTQTWLAMIHDRKQIAYANRNERARWHYLHYFAEYDINGLLTRISDPIVFGSGERVEFAAGMVEWYDELLISAGFADAEMGIARIPKDKALATLKPYDPNVPEARELTLSHPMRTIKPDIVIPVKESDNYESLRYVLRSIDENCPQIGTVWLVGAKPDWATNVRHLPIKHAGRRKYERINEVWESLGRTYDISEHFVWLNDDIFVMKPTYEFENYRSTKPILRTSNNYYEKSITDTQTLIHSIQGRNRAFVDYDLHTPFSTYRSHVRKATSAMRQKRGLYQYRSAIGNLMWYDGVESADVKVRHPNKEPAGNETYISLTNTIWEHGKAGKWLRQRFSKPSKYEK